MDKNKSRTDLLAAGRKKLQQYRQKKDGKGSSSHGKSSKKSSKSEQKESDDDTTAKVAKSSKLDQSSEREILSPTDSSLGNVEPKLENPVEVDPLSASVTSERGVPVTALSDSVHADMQDVDFDNDRDSTNLIEGQSVKVIVEDVTNLAPSGPSDIPDSEGETKHDGSALLAPGIVIDHAVETERINRQEELESGVAMEVGPLSASVTSEPGVAVTALSNSVYADMQDVAFDNEGQSVQVIVEDVTNLGPLGPSDIPDLKGETKHDGGALLAPGVVIDHTMNTVLETERINRQEEEPGVAVEVDPLSASVTSEPGVAVTALSDSVHADMQDVDNDNDRDSTNLIEGQSVQVIVEDAPNLAPLGQSDIPDSGWEAKHDGSALLAPGVVIDHTMNTSLETERINRPEELESSSSREDATVMSAIPGRGYQVGEMQETNSQGSVESSAFNYVADKGDEMLAVSVHHEVSECAGRLPPEQIGVEEAVTELKQTDETDFVLASSAVTNTADGALIVAPSDGASFAVNEARDQQEQVFRVGQSDIQQIEMVPGPGDPGQDWEECNQSERMVAEDSSLKYLPDEPFVFVDKIHERTSDDTCPISFSQLIEVLGGLGEEEVRLLLNSRRLVCGVDLGASALISSFHALPQFLERLSEELFLATCTKDILYLLLSELSNIQTENDHQLHHLGDVVSMLQASLQEAHERNDYLSKELAESRSELLATVIGREELQHQLHSAKAEIDAVYSRAFELQNRLERSESDFLNLSKESADCKDVVVMLRLEIENLNGTLASLTNERDSCLHQNEKLLKELADCKNLMAALQDENSNLSIMLASVTEERKNLEGEKECLAASNEKVSLELADCKGVLEARHIEIRNLSADLALVTAEREKFEADKKVAIQENEKLSSELLVFHERLSEDHGEQMRLEAELKEVTTRLELLMEENMFLKSSGDIHKAQVREIDTIEHQQSSLVGEAANEVGRLEVQSKDCEHSHQIPVKPDGETSFLTLEKSESDGLAGGPPTDLLKLKACDFSGFKDLKIRLEEANELLQKLETTVETHSSVVVSRPGSNVPAPAVSKLIQAFESKVQVDESEVEDMPITADQLPVADPFAATKEHTRDLKAVLKQLAQDAENADTVWRAEQDGRPTANHAIRELEFQVETLKEYSDKLEASNIDLDVLYAALNEHVSDVKEKNNQLHILYETSNQQYSSLNTENFELRQELIESVSTIKELQSQLINLQKNTDGIASIHHHQLEKLQQEANERALASQQVWTSTTAATLEVIQRLDDSIGLSLCSVVSDSTLGSADLCTRVAFSVNAAVKMIDDMKDRIEAARREHETASTSFNKVNEKYNELVGENELAKSTMTKLYCELKEIVSGSGSLLKLNDNEIQDEELCDGVDYARYRVLIELLKNFLAESLQLHSVNSKLNLDLMNRTNEVEELRIRCVDLDSIQKLVHEVEDVLNLEDAGIDLDRSSASCLESLVVFMVNKYKEANELFNSLKEEFRYKVLEQTELQEKMYQLTALQLQHESEIHLLKEHLIRADEALDASRSELQAKVNEVEQSDQKLSSIREKLSIAVAKGKGLIVQRDSLKQSLAETSNELERCSQELQLKDARLHEMETKLKIYSEAGERMESLESELSYIRNSATALRESFLMKDSLLQRIEEILEDLDLPEHFHSRDIIEKVDWLAKSATANSLPLTDWDQKDSVEGSYMDAGFVALDAQKEDIQQNPDSANELRRQYDELQSKFYGLAEQNEMLEQSLVERNLLVRRWEELLDNIDMPSHVRSMEPEDKIGWLGNALSECTHDKNSLLQKNDKLESYCGSVTTELEESEKQLSFLNDELESSQMRIRDLEKNLQAVMRERDNASERLGALTVDQEKQLARVMQFELDNEKLMNELSDLQGELAKKIGIENHIQQIGDTISRLYALVCDTLKDPGATDLVSGASSTDQLEGVLRKLIENYTHLSSAKPAFMNAEEEQHAKQSDADLVEARSMDTLDVAVPQRENFQEEPDLGILKQELEATLSELRCAKEERDSYFEKQQSMNREVEAVNQKMVELQELLNQEEQKSISFREKLNVAVRRGKLLVQQRDSLKQTNEGVNTELERLKYEIKQRDNALVDYEQKTKDLTTYSERVETLESESLLLRKSMAEIERCLQEKGHTLTLILDALGNIDVGGDIINADPIEKLEYIAKVCHDLRVTLASSEQESRKSRRAAELLVAELNEVQDRNDGLQEELAKATSALAELSKERDMAEAAKLEAFSQIEKVSTVNSEQSRRQFSELMVLKSVLDQLRKNFLAVNSSLPAFFSKELEFLKSMEAGVDSCLKSRSTGVNHVVDVPPFSSFNGITSNNLEKESFVSRDILPQSNLPDNLNDNIIVEVCASVQELMEEVGTMQAILSDHSMALHQQASNLSKLIGMFHVEMTSQIEAFEALKRDFKLIESAEMEATVLRRNIALLYEACTSSLQEIENRQADSHRNISASGEEGLKLKQELYVKSRDSFGGENSFLTEEHVKSLAERLLTVVKDFACSKGEIPEGKEKEMKWTISNLQKELQDKDLQRERICTELVSQIKKAEAAATSYSLDLQSARTKMNDLEQQLQMVNEEKTVLEQSVKNLKEGQLISTELQDKVGSMTNLLSAKDQEIEALMQAIEEEEVQMEDLNNKIMELETVLQQKNSDIENLESSRGKVLKKLSITVSKFDELHHFSETLLTEVEKLQSQLQDRDTEISFLRQEVTRCTNDVLASSQMNSKRNSDEIHELLAWLDMSISEVGAEDENQGHNNMPQGLKEMLQSKVTSILSKLRDLQVVANSKDELFQMERGQVEELTHKVETLEKSLHEKESRLNMLEDVRGLGQPANAPSEILEVEPVINKRTVSGPSTVSHVRSLRKSNNDQIAIAIDDETGGSNRVDDGDDDKVHGFKSLTTSRLIPKFTRPITDMVDGLWVSCDRALMRQPALRLGIIIYWAILHSLVAAFVV